MSSFLWRPCRELSLTFGHQISLPPHRWFLSLYINSMPLIFAFRIVDCVLAMGVKVLFQIGLGESISPAWVLSADA